MFLNATATHSVYNFNTGVDFSDELTENGATTTSRFARSTNPALKTTQRSSTSTLRPTQDILCAVATT